MRGVGGRGRAGEERIQISADSDQCYEGVYSIVITSVIGILYVFDMVVVHISIVKNIRLARGF